MKQLVSQLKSLKSHRQISPDAVWVASAREQLLSQINLVEKEKAVSNNLWRNFFAGYRLLFTSRFHALARPTFAAIMVVFTSIVGWGATVSASYSIPGDALYGVKLATEQTQIAVAGLVGAKEKKSALLGKAAKNRAAETRALVEQKKMDKVDASLESLKESINQVQASLKDVQDNQPDSTKNVTDQVTNTTAEVVSTLNQVLVNLPMTDLTTSTATLDLVNKIVDAQQDASNKNMEAVGVMVAKQQNGEINLTNEETQQLVVDAITQTTGAMISVAAPDKLSAAPAGAIKTSVQNAIIATSTIIIGTTSTLANLATAMSSSTDSGATVMEKVNQVMQVETDAAKKMAENGQLLEALQAAKQVSDVSGEIKQAVVMAAQEVVAVPTVTGSATAVVVTSTTKN